MLTIRSGRTITSLTQPGNTTASLAHHCTTGSHELTRVCAESIAKRVRFLSLTQLVIAKDTATTTIKVAAVEEKAAAVEKKADAAYRRLQTKNHNGGGEGRDRCVKAEKAEPR